MKVRGKDCRDQEWTGFWTGRIEYFEGDETKWHRVLISSGRGRICPRWLKEIKEI